VGFAAEWCHQRAIVRHGDQATVGVEIPAHQRGVCSRSAQHQLVDIDVSAETDLVCAVPRRFAAAHAARFGLKAVESPVPLGRFNVNLVVPQSR